MLDASTTALQLSLSKNINFEMENDKEEQLTVKECLLAMELEIFELQLCLGDLQEEFKLIKKAYFKRVLQCHPDKPNGDAATFRHVNAAFELLRSMFEQRSVQSFAAEAEKQKPKKHRAGLGGFKAQSHAFYEQAAEELVPTYRVVLAKSARSKCNQKTPSARKCAAGATIPKNAVRVGSINLESGSYGRWCHVECWRVPAAVWMGLPDLDQCQDYAQFESALTSMNEVVFCGFNELSEQDRELVVQHVMNKEHWASHRKIKRETQNVTSGLRANENLTLHDNVESSSNKCARTDNDTSVAIPKVEKETASQALVKGKGGKQQFVVPLPDSNPECLNGKTIVLTGIFPEIGGGVGLNLGKDRMKRMIKSFGGKVTSAVSGRTDYLIVGQEPGMSKVSKAREMPKCQLVSPRDLVRSIEGQAELKELPAPEISSFSTGFRNNGLALLPSREDNEAAAGRSPPSSHQVAKAKKSGKSSSYKAGNIGRIGSN